MQNCSSSSALAVEIPRSCTKPSIWCSKVALNGARLLSTIAGASTPVPSRLNSHIRNSLDWVRSTGTRSSNQLTWLVLPIWHQQTSPSDANKCDIAINSLWPSEAIWRQGSRSTLVQVMVCCLTAPSHYLNQCWLIITKVQWCSSEGNFARYITASSH